MCEGKMKKETEEKRERMKVGKRQRLNDDDKQWECKDDQVEDDEMTSNMNEQESPS